MADEPTPKQQPLRRSARKPSRGKLAFIGIMDLLNVGCLSLAFVVLLPLLVLVR